MEPSTFIVFILTYKTWPSGSGQKYLAMPGAIRIRTHNLSVPFKENQDSRKDAKIAKLLSGKKKVKIFLGVLCALA